MSHVCVCVWNVLFCLIVSIFSCKTKTMFTKRIVNCHRLHPRVCRMMRHRSTPRHSRWELWVLVQSLGQSTQSRSLSTRPPDLFLSFHGMKDACTKTFQHTLVFGSPIGGVYRSSRTTPFLYQGLRSSPTAPHKPRAAPFLS